MKVSIITAVLNNRIILEDCIRSIMQQTYQHKECIVVDGGSTDGTMDIIKKYERHIAKWISEPDRGLYDALNKGIRIATGDIVGFLNADDFYANNKVIETVVKTMKEQNVDSCYGDLQYVDKKNIQKVIRYWKSSPYKKGLFYKGWMPPHPTFFVKKKIYEQYGSFNTQFRIAADYELMLRFLEKHKITTHYIPEVLIKMRLGGLSNRIENLLMKSTEDYNAWKINNLDGGLRVILRKNISKIPQFFWAFGKKK
jgi:glycosyltransferase